MTVRPSAGMLRRSVSIERREEGSDDGYGNYTYDWQPLRQKPFSAQISPIRGRETTIAGANAGVFHFNIIVRYSNLTKDITAGDRVVDVRNGKTYNVTFPADFSEKNRFVKLLCTFGNPDG